MTDSTKPIGEVAVPDPIVLGNTGARDLADKLIGSAWRRIP